MRRLGIASILFLLCVGVPGARDAVDDLIVEAMQDEMDRSMAGLRLPDQPAPYYIAYTIHDTTRTSLTAALGALMADTTGRSRLLHVEVRVGDYDFDSSHFATAGRPPRIVIVTLDDDYLSLRRRIWMATDAAYKRAVDVYARKKATFQNRVNTNPVPDFSKETPREHLAPTPAPRPVGASWRDTVRHVSAIFGEMPEIHQAQVSLSVTQGTRYFLNSEGFKTVAPVELATLAVQAQTQAADGMVLRDSFTTVGKTLDDLPSRADATGRARELAASLVELRDAPVGDDYYGPVMLEGQAAGQLLARSLVPLFLSQRPPTRDRTGRGGGGPGLRGRREGGGGAGLGGGRSTPFLRRLGSRVLPESLTVTDTPSLTSYGNAPVPGAYVVDEEGVLAQDVTLVQDGRLMTLLTSRAPQLNLPTSNGHARGGDAQASVFQLTSTSGVPATDLKAKYLELLTEQNRPFGYIIRGVAGTRRTVKVTPDGQESLVRGVALGRVAQGDFRDILEVSEEQALYTYRPAPSATARLTGAFPSPDVVVTVIAPNLLFDYLEVEQVRPIPQTPPIVPSPLRR